MEAEAARRLLVKLRRFVSEELDSEERALFAALLAPGVAQAYAGEEEVEGFGMPSWSPAAFPEALVQALREAGVKVVGLDPE